MNRKNVICLSWCDADDVVNYGQILQALAMMELLRQETMGEIKYLSYSARGIRSRLKYFYDHVNNKNGHFTAYKKTRKTIKTVVKKNKVEFHQIQGKRIKNSLTSDIDILI